MRRVLLISITLALPGVGLAAPVTAAASSGSAIVRDCADNSRIDGHYTAQQYRDALANLPADVDEYTDCRDIIRAGQLAAAGKGGSRSGGGPTAVASAVHKATKPKTKAEHAAVLHARRSGDVPIRVGGETVTPGASLAANTHSLPGSLLGALILLGVATLVGIARTVNRRVSSRRQG